MAGNPGWRFDRILKILGSVLFRQYVQVPEELSAVVGQIREDIEDVKKAVRERLAA